MEVKDAHDSLNRWRDSPSQFDMWLKDFRAEERCISSVHASTLTENIAYQAEPYKSYWTWLGKSQKWRKEEDITSHRLANVSPPP